jgi:hypothetical protein
LQVLAALRNIFPDASYPDEANAEADDISAAELQRRQRARPPAKVLQVCIPAWCFYHDQNNDPIY